jgi:ubiquinone/menaquinone biosynthesis C-methylase UbiE
MAQQSANDDPGNPAQNYQDYFVKFVGRPVADDLMEVAALRLDESVLDVACGTGEVARLAKQAVGPGGRVVGLDLNPGMLGVARKHTPNELPIEWVDASAESMPLPDNSFDVVLCQMGLQFVPDKAGALKEMHRTLAPHGRVAVNLPGPTPGNMGVIGEALGKHVDPRCAGFVNMIFSLHDADKLRTMFVDAGFTDVNVHSMVKELQVPMPADWLWQFSHSTPLAEFVAKADGDKRAMVERDVVAAWKDPGTVEVKMTTIVARK